MLPDEFYHDQREGFRDCFVVTVDTHLAGVIWVLEGSNASRYVRLEKGQIELGYLYVLPSYRGKGLAKVLYWQAASAWNQKGARDIFAVIAEDNLPSKKAAEAVGFRPLASIRRSPLLGHRFSTGSASTRPRDFQEP
jgi:RimJ/RimL family protein N-acetyltransferase